MIRNKLASEITIATSGTYDIGSTSDGLPSAFNAPYYELVGTPSMNGNFNITHSTITAPERFTTAIFHNIAVPVLNGNHVTILGVQVPDDLAGLEYMAYAFWTGAAWNVQVVPNMKLSNVVSSDNLKDDSVSDSKLASNAVITDKIASNAVTADKLNVGSVTADKLGVGAVTAEKIGTGAVTADKIGANAVGSDKIAANAVVEAKIANNAVTANKIANNAVTADKIADGSVTAAKLAAGTFGASNLSANSVESAKIAASAVIEDKIADNAVTASKVANGAITANKVSNDLKKETMSVILPVITYAGITHKIYIPYKCQLTHVDTCCLATMNNTATNYERLNFKDHAGNNMAGGSLDSGNLKFPDAFSVGAVLGTDIDTNNGFTAGQYLQLKPEVNVATTGVILLNLIFTIVE